MKITQNRLDLMDTETVTVDGAEYRVKDPLSLKYRDFELNRRAGEHVVIQSEVRRPDLISYGEYGTVWYWWFIAAMNGVVDPYEMPESNKLRVPHLLDYHDWYRDQKETA
jgi:hypothetical protein